MLDAIKQAKDVRKNTLTAIKALTDTPEGRTFRIKHEDIEALKNLFKPYM